ncbi:MAG: glycosyltransferase [Anaerolineales bacterium]|nr:glycosyltransferase [Anaerolineales bacterium]
MQRKIKIVYLIGQLGLGGSERQLYLLLKHLDPSKFEAAVIVFNPSAYVTLDEAIRQLGFQVFAIPESRRSILPRLIYIYKVLRRLAPDIVHSWTIHDNPYAGIAGWLAGVKVRWGSARDSIHAKGFGGLPAFYKWLAFNIVSRIVVNAESIYEELSSKGISANKISLLPNCVEISADAEPMELSQFGVPENGALIGLVGNLRKKKNHFMFIEGMERVLSKHPNAYGIIVGQPIPDEMEYHQELKTKLSDSKLAKRVFLTGFRDDVPALMRQMTIFCMTSDYEGTPNAILEAMAAAKPVIATRVGGIPNMVEDGVSGFLVEAGDANSLANAINKLLLDPALAEAMGQAGREIVEARFGCGQVIAQLQNLYYEAVHVRR